METTTADLTFEALMNRFNALERAFAQSEAEKTFYKNENARLQAEVKRLTEELAAARKNSRNSSKPPSSDIIKPQPKGKQSERKIGGQRGHPPNFRTLFTPEQLDEAFTYDPLTMTCPCGGHLERCAPEDQVQQQIDLPESPLIRREHRARAFRCRSCNALHRGTLPEHVKREGFIGINLATALAFLNGKARASYSTLSAFVEDVLGEPISTGQLAKTFLKVSDALEKPYYELLRRLPTEPILNIDETGHYENGKKFWTWAFCAKDFTVFHIDESRSSKVLESILGPDFQGTIGCDYFGAYQKYLKGVDATAQFCLAHLIRELRFLAENSARETKRWAIRSLAAVRRMFRVHRSLAENPGSDRQKLVRAGERFRAEVLKAPAESKAQNIARRFLENGDSYLRFIGNPEIEPTNNRAEQNIRPAVLDRNVSQGTRSQDGRDYKERIWTVLSTCARRGVSAYRYIRDALKAYVHQAAAPP